jgi:hypothetical protein
METDWVPAACTLPTVEQPLRVAEFAALIAGSSAVHRPAPTVLEVELPAAVRGRTEDLAARETACCSFFRFEVLPRGETVLLRVQVPPEHTAVLDALGNRS